MRVQHKSNTKVFFAKYYLAHLLVTNRRLLSTKQIELLESVKRFVDRNNAITDNQNRVLKSIYYSKCPVISPQQAKYIESDEAQ